MAWTSKKLVHLRRQLGWSRTDLARRLGLESRVIEGWETGALGPDEESTPQLDYLESQFSSFSERFFAQPRAEIYMRENNLDQISVDDID